MGRTTRTPQRARAKAAAKKKPAAKKRAPKQRRKGSRDWGPRWLKAFEETGMVTESCRVAQVGRTTVYERRGTDDAFREAWDDIEERSTELMEAEAVRRARDGVDEPVYQKGECVGHVRKYSDTLLIFMLKSRRPDKYREHVQVDHAGTVKHERSVDLSKLSDEELQDLERITAAATAS